MNKVSVVCFFLVSVFTHTFEPAALSSLPKAMIVFDFNNEAFEAAIKKIWQEFVENVQQRIKKVGVNVTTTKEKFILPILFNLQQHFIH